MTSLVRLRSQWDDWGFSLHSLLPSRRPAHICLHTRGRAPTATEPQCTSDFPTSVSCLLKSHRWKQVIWPNPGPVWVGVCLGAWLPGGNWETGKLERGRSPKPRNHRETSQHLYSPPPLCLRQFQHREKHEKEKLCILQPYFPQITTNNPASDRYCYLSTIFSMHIYNYFTNLQPNFI